MLGRLNNSQIEDVLNNQIVGRIGCHADDITYIVPISYAYDGAYVFAHTFEGKKISIMRKNSNVCFEVDVIKDMANWQSVVAWGNYEELGQGDDRDYALEKLSGRALALFASETVRLSEDWPFPISDMSEIQGIVFRIRLMQKTGRFEQNDSSSFGS